VKKKNWGTPYPGDGKGRLEKGGPGQNREKERFGEHSLKGERL